MPDKAADDARVEQVFRYLLQAKLPSLKPILPLLLNWDGRPFTLDDHFPFEPLFNTSMPKRIVLKTGRQLGKTTGIAAQGTVISGTLPNFNTLFVTPLFEQIRRFSGNYVRKFIEFSPLKHLFMDSKCYNSVMQRTFLNNSTMFFSFAFLDADRIRGLSAAKFVIDEIQDLDPDFIPIIRETTSASKWGLEQFTGTPKTLDGCLEQVWLQSSKAEWVMRCEACNYWNIPALEYDLDAMTGPNFVTRDITPFEPGVVCAKCGRPLQPRKGRWIHRYPELRFDFAGYHIPQMIMPMHYSDPDKWAILLGKRQGFANTPQNVYYNECCGESFDTGAKLLTETDLRAAAILHENRYDLALQKIGNYKRRVLAVDWGGGGETGQSFTTAAVLGMLPNGRIDVIYGWRSLTPHDHFGEAKQLIRLLVDFRCGHMVHDYTGAGALRETVMTAARVPLDRLLPVAYIRAASGPIMRYVPENQNTGQRSHYRVDKARSLVLTCNLIRKKWVRFFAFDFKGPSHRGLLYDFLALIEDKVDSRTGSDIYTVIRNEKAGPDDFAQAVNIGVCALFHAEGRWPDLGEIEHLALTPSQLAGLTPSEDIDWDSW